MAANTPERSGTSSGAPLARSTPGTARGNAMEPQRDREGTLTHVIETLLDKGLVINADIMVSVAGVELLGIRIRAALASFETAARYGLEFPAGTDRDTVAWNEAIEQKETCPECGKRAPLEQLLNEFCPWCGWKSAQALEAAGNRNAPTEDNANSGTESKSVGTRNSSSGKSAASGKSGSGSKTGSASKQADS
ncbi:gas vesicle protein [Arthrobacter pigmenti]